MSPSVQEIDPVSGSSSTMAGQAGRPSILAHSETVLHEVRLEAGIVGLLWGLTAGKSLVRAVPAGEHLLHLRRVPHLGQQPPLPAGLDGAERPGVGNSQFLQSQQGLFRFQVVVPPLLTEDDGTLHLDEGLGLLCDLPLLSVGVD